MAEKKEAPTSRYQFYGKMASADEVHSFLESVFKLNELADAHNTPKLTACLWGHPGLGKTDLVKAFRNDGYEVIHVPPAQFEEMGDFHGLPVEDRERKVTAILTPEWVPKREGKGILLLDDFNRADIRIIKGVMQLIQDYKMVTWEMPKGWNIVLTANPDGGEHLVTSLDTAQLTRLKHISLKPDHKAWARWAERAKVAPCGINFLLKYPEQMIVGERTNPRSWTQAFEIFKIIPEVKANTDEYSLVEAHLYASVDEDAATSMMTFLIKGLDEIIEPEEILEDFEKVEEKFKKLIKEKKLDAIGISTERLLNRITNPEFDPGSDEKGKNTAARNAKNVRAFLKTNSYPQDLRYMFVQRVFHSKTGKHAQAFLMGDQDLVGMLAKVVA
jgi:hypothetical protein